MEMTREELDQETRYSWSSSTHGNPVRGSRRVLSSPVYTWTHRQMEPESQESLQKKKETLEEMRLRHDQKEQERYRKEMARYRGSQAKGLPMEAPTPIAPFVEPFGASYRKHPEASGGASGWASNVLSKVVQGENVEEFPMGLAGNKVRTYSIEYKQGDVHESNTKDEKRYPRTNF